MPLSVTLAEMNRLNREFWAEESPRARARMEHSEIRSFVDRQLRSDALRQVPIRFRETIEIISASAEDLRNRMSEERQRKLSAEEVEAARRSALHEQARKGGMASKTDALQRLIEQREKENPTLTVPKLFAILENEVHCGTIEEIDYELGLIWFEGPRGTLKKASISGLKDRLYRAKRKTRLR